MVNAFASSVTARNTVVVHRALTQGDGTQGDGTQRNDVEIVETNQIGRAHV